MPFTMQCFLILAIIGTEKDTEGFTRPEILTKSKEHEI